MSAELTELPRPAARSFDTILLPELGDFRYHVRLPRAADPGRVLVAVHGISRQSESMIRWLGEIADEFGYSILAPHFSNRDFRGYQRLGGIRGGRADSALLAMIDDAEQMIPGLSQERFFLFGFSGGAQFAHRFMLLQGHRVAAMAVAAAGWYTPLDYAQKFPWGLGTGRRLKGATLSARKLVSAPSLTMVGVDDVGQDKNLRLDPRIDELQGVHRVARARWWHMHLRRSANQMQISASHEFRLLPGTGHDFEQAVLHGSLDRHLFEFCEGHRIRRYEDSS